MTIANTLEHLGFRRLAEAYTHAVDGRRAELFETIMTDTIEVVGPTCHVQRLDAVRRISAMLNKRYLATRHVVHNQLVSIDGDRADGSVSCNADHVWQPIAGGPWVVRWFLLYVNSFVRRDGSWLIDRQQITVDWTEKRPVTRARGTTASLPRLRGGGDPIPDLST